MTNSDEEGSAENAAAIRFDAFLIDPRAGRLTRAGQAIPLRPKTWGVLLYLARLPGVRVTRADLLDAVWPDVAVRMKRRLGASPKDGSSAIPPVSKAVPALPAWKAFVVQFTREAGGVSGVFAGRIEHLSSGRRVRFGSPDELVKILERLLDELGSDS
jgi:hypothetical protein